MKQNRKELPTNLDRRWLTALLLGGAVAGTGTSGCGQGIDVAEWTEEVKLHDGRIVVVWRKARARSSGFPNAKRGGDIDFEFKYEPMGVHWKSVNWSRDPFSFEIINGVPYLALYISDRESCQRKPRSDYAAQFLRWSDGQWMDVPQAEFPIDKALMNLSGNYWGHSTADDYRGLIRWEGKRLPGRPDDTIKSYFERDHYFCSIFHTN